ncbi:hypothetical protein NON20_15330 [Synechocystis sp. B12]|nr:hypothetical protein NON20_15330 [Synechocystis sp. B12]
MADSRSERHYRVGGGLSWGRKRTVGKKSMAQVVDMENTAVLAFGEAKQIPVAILRVVSDTVDQDLPDLNGVFTEQGLCNPYP